MITSLSNEKVKKLVSLQTKKGRNKEGLFLVEGEHMLADAIKFKLPIKEIFVAESKKADFDKLLCGLMCDITLVSDEVFKKISNTETFQGIAFSMKIPESINFDFKKSKFLVLDRISDPGNMGTIVRTAIATGFEHIVCLNTVDVFSPKVVRSSSGGIFWAKFQFLTEDEFLSKIDDCPLFVASAEGKNVFEINTFPNAFGLVIGNEALGVSKKIKNVGKIISLPMSKKIESLNAAVSASVLMFLLSK